MLFRWQFHHIESTGAWCDVRKKKAAVLLRGLWTMRHDGFLWSTPKAARLFLSPGGVRRDNFPPLTKGASASSHFDPQRARYPAPSKMRGDARRRLFPGFKVPLQRRQHRLSNRRAAELSRSLSAEDSFAGDASHVWKRLLTSAGGECRCTLVSEGFFFFFARTCVGFFFSFWGRGIETGMTRGCLKSERKHSPALSSH